MRLTRRGRVVVTLVIVVLWVMLVAVLWQAAGCSTASPC